MSIPTPTDILKKKYGNIVEGPQGYSMPEKTARKIEELSKGLPADFTFRRMAKSPASFVLTDGDRADVSTITTDSVDRDGDVVLPEGLDRSHFNAVVPFAHKYDQLPVGTCQWIKPTPDGHGLVARTFYPTKPDDWGDAPWMPSAVLHLMVNGTCTGKSIGFLPTSVRPPTAQEKAMRPDWKDATIIDKAALLEYSVVSVPANQDAELISVAKALKGVPTELAEMFAASFGLSLKDMGDEQTDSMPSCPKCLSPDKVSKKGDDGEYTCSMCGDFTPAASKDLGINGTFTLTVSDVVTPEMKAAEERQAKIAAALIAPWYDESAYQKARRLESERLKAWAAAETRRTLTDALDRARGRV